MIKRRNTLRPIPEERKLRLREQMMILSRRDRMGKALPTWYRVLAAAVVLCLVVVLAGSKRTDELRNRSVAAEPLIQGTVRLSFAGDMDLSDNVAALGEAEGYEPLFSGVSPLWADSAYVFSCLDGVVQPESGELEALETADSPNPVAAAALSAAAAAGINACSLANDHSFDYGSAGLAETVRRMQELGLQYAGAGEDLTAAGDYRVLEADGLTIGFIACSAVNPNGPGPIDDYCLTTTAYSALYRNVLLASDTTDLVVVYVCWGEQDAVAVSDAQRRVAHQLIQSGADVVIGTHPHVLQPVEQYQGGWIFYSLGNLVSDQNMRSERESVLVRLDLDQSDGSGTLTLIPLLLQDYCPTATENGFYVDQIHYSLLRELEEGSYEIEDNGRITLPFRLS